MPFVMGVDCEQLQNWFGTGISVTLWICMVMMKDHWDPRCLVAFLVKNDD